MIKMCCVNDESVYINDDDFDVYIVFNLYILYYCFCKKKENTKNSIC